MRWACSCLLCGFAVASNAGCGRLGVDLLSDQGAASADDAGEPEDAVPGDAAASAEDALDAAADAGTADDDLDASPADAGARDAAALDGSASDAAGLDAAARDAAAGEASVDAAASACQLTVGGATVNYALGDVGRLEGTLMLSLTQSGLCAMPSGCSVDPAQDVLQTSCSVSPCQMWESIDASAGYFYLRNAKNGLCMNVSDAADGTRLSDHECSGGDAMRWQAVCAGSNSWQLVNRLSNLPLQASASSANSPVTQSAQPANAAQRWTIRANASAYNVVMTSAESDERALWRYTTGAPGGSWMQTGFDDASWSTGPGAFGSQARGSTPVRTDWTSPDLWLRRDFSLSSVPASLTIKMFHDEAAEVYINGNLVVQLNRGSSGYEAIDVPAVVLSSLLAGSNLIAVHSQNSSAPQFIDVGLLSYTWR